MSMKSEIILTLLVDANLHKSEQSKVIRRIGVSESLFVDSNPESSGLIFISTNFHTSQFDVIFVGPPKMKCSTMDF